MPARINLADREITWDRTREKKAWYFLAADGTEIVRLRTERMLGTLARAVAGDREWTFKRTGFFHPRVTVRRAGEETEVAVFHPSWTGTGLLEFEDGRVLRWSPTMSWGREWSWTGADREVLMRFRGRPDKCRMQFESAVRTEKDVALLAALGIYLIMMAATDQSMMAASAAAAAAASAG